MWMKKLSILLFSATFLCPQESPPRSALDRIRAEAQRESQAMTYAFYLTDVHGPRLTGSPSFEKAGKWAMTAMNAMGLQDVHSELLNGLGKG